MNEQPKPYIPSEDEFNKAEEMAFEHNPNHGKLRKISEEWAEKNREQIIENLQKIIRESALTEEFIDRVMHQCRKVVELNAMPKLGETSEFGECYYRGRNPNGPILEGYRAREILDSILGIDLGRGVIGLKKLE